MRVINAWRMVNAGDVGGAKVKGEKLGAMQIFMLFCRNKDRTTCLAGG